MPESQAVTVGRLVADGWRAYRAIRLAMLQESPSAFCSTHDDAVIYDEQLWKQRLTDNVVLVAQVDGTTAGSVMFSDRSAADPGDCSLNGMWVDPAFRRTGVAQALVHAVVAQARAAGKRRVILHVVADNTAARALYEREGFVATGHGGPYPSDDQPIEIEMCLVLDNRSG
jgi:ribosomal protein S18 acetylase RimI-like enzyme